MSVLVVLEQRSGNWNRMSFEALGAGQKIAKLLGTALETAVLGSGIGSLA
jgi:electron transfer flavoprotein alpha subunit